MKELKDYLKEDSQEYDYKEIVKDWLEEHPGEADKKAMKALMSFGSGAFNPRRIMKERREAGK